jgi:hypothetical protein
MSQVLLSRAQSLHQGGRLDEARAFYDQTLAADPDNAEALHLLGYLWFQKGDPGRAVQLISRAIELKPSNPGYRYNRALILQQTGLFEPAAADFQQVAALEPADLGAWEGLGETLLNLGRAEEAVQAWDRALALRPASAELNSNRGVALRVIGRLDEALAAHDRALAADPRYPDGWSNRGNVLKDLGRLDEAMDSFDRALALNPQMVQALVNRANVLRELARMPEALADYDRAIALAPTYPEAHHHRAVLMLDLQRLAEAVASFESAIALRRPYPEAEVARAMTLLHAGDFEQGLPLYEGRTLFPPEAAQDRPRWLGREPIAGQTVLVWAEQGLGDTLQFCRYAPLLAAQGARVVLQVQTPLVPLLRGLPGVEAVIGPSQAPPPFEHHIPLLSLPLALGTRLETIPAPAAYLQPDPVRVEAWAQRLGPATRKRIGLVWSGAAGHRNDRHRSLSLARLLAALPEGFEYIGLQQEIRTHDQATLDAHPQVRSFSRDLNDFTDTAALISLMDAVVSVDTSIAHLAGALGKDVRVLLARIGQDWRWMAEGPQTPWYPSMRLYRQGADNDWTGPLQAVGADLATL